MPAEPFQLLFRLLHKKIRSCRVDWNLQSLLLCMCGQCLRILHRCAAVRCFVIQHQLYPLAAIFLCLVDGIKACKSPVLIQPFKAVSTDTTLHVPLLFGCCVKCLPLPIYQIREWAQGLFFAKKLSVFYKKTDNSLFLLSPSSLWTDDPYLLLQCRRSRRGTRSIPALSRAHWYGNGF